MEHEFPVVGVADAVTAVPKPGVLVSNVAELKPLSKEALVTSTQESILFRKEMASKLGVRSVGAFSPEGIATYQTPNNESYFVTREGQRFGPFEHVYSFHDGFAQVKMADGWYLINAACLGGAEDAKRAHGPYSAVTEMVQGRYAAYDEMKKVWTFFDAEGKEKKGWGVCESVLSMWGPYSLVRKDGKKRLLDASGVEVVGVNAEHALRVCEGYLLIQMSAGRQFVSLMGEKDSPVFKFALEFSSGVAPVEEAGGTGMYYVDKDWKEVQKLGRHRFAHPYFEDVALVHGGGGVLRKMDTEGKDVGW